MRVKIALTNEAPASEIKLINRMNHLSSRVQLTELHQNQITAVDFLFFESVLSSVFSSRILNNTDMLLL